MNQPVFHPLEGRGDCVGCHGTGLQDAPGMPLSHQGMPSVTCLTCHPPAAPQATDLYALALPFALLFALGVLRLLRGWPRPALLGRAAQAP